MLFTKGSLLKTESNTIYLVAETNLVNNVVVEVSLVDGDLNLIDNPHIRPIDSECCRWGTWKKIHQLSATEFNLFTSDFKNQKEVTEALNQNAITIG